ncbi:MAG TPA: hypothetical protein P5060_03170 [Candidatus Absconditabacterales bacterium]|nr:hypothetical protein [Candidatus Absconditabacterales bacterium]
MKNIEDDNIVDPNLDENEDIESNEEKSESDIAKDFDDYMEKLKNIAKAEAESRNQEGDYETIIDDFFEKAEKVDNDLENTDEIEKEIGRKFKRTRTVKKYNSIENRNIDVQNAIKESGESVLDEITNWKEEKNPVAKSLLSIANWILKTEK